MAPRKSRPYEVPKADKKSKQSMNQSYIASCLPSPDKSYRQSAIDNSLDRLADEISKDCSRELGLKVRTL